jgi:hypothetical protein
MLAGIVLVSPFAYQDYTRTHGGNPNEVIVWAETRFTAAGLSLPEYQFTPDSAECGGHLAVFDGTTVRNCAAGTRLYRVMLHELAHVWAYTNLTPDDEARLVAEWGTAAWNDPAIPHDSRGVEQFADMIAWALHPIRADGCCSLTAEQMLRTLADLGITPLWA